MTVVDDDDDDECITVKCITASRSVNMKDSHENIEWNGDVNLLFVGVPCRIPCCCY